MKLRPFELALVVIFIGLAMLALFLLANFESNTAESPDGTQVAIGTVTIWGTLDQEAMTNLLVEMSEDNDAYLGVSYRYYHPNDFDSILLNALADNRGPDLILVSHEKLVDMRRRIQPVSYESFPIRDIRNLYIDGAQIFALSDGLYGFPVAVDPLMMYWNKDILATEGYLEAPRTWERLVNDMFPNIIQRGFDRSIQRSVVAMGEYGNVRNAFGIVSALMIQGGSKRVVEDADGQYIIQLQSSESGSGDPLRSAADFYTRFSQPSNQLYSWNRAFGEDRIQFVAEDLALYFGYGSEGPQIERINPNLNFDIAEIPQGANSTIRRTYGRFYGISMLRSSDNQVGAGAVMYNLGNGELSARIAIDNDMVPVYRNTVTAGSNDTYGRITYQSASIALGWLNPDIQSSDDIFETMVQDINENRRDLVGAVSDVSGRLQNEY